MDRIAIFVDAGYLYAQGSALLSGAKKKRQFIQVDETEVEAALQRVLMSIGSTNLLRIYWYDGASATRGPSAAQVRFANRDNFKLRLGFLNSHGEQKGVDSLIVTDMVELARNKAIADAVLLSGDEDVRIGVQLAQNHGIRVHLLGIKPSRGSQSQTLMHEADTTREWDEDVVRAFMTILPEQAAPAQAIAEQAPIATVVTTTTTQTTTVTIAEDVDRLATAFCERLQDSDLDVCVEFWRSGQRGVPPEYDGRLMGSCKSALGPTLSSEQVRAARRVFNERMKERARVAGK